MTKRVLVVVRSLRIGGMERVAVNLCDAFAEEGHEVHLLSMKHSKEELSPQSPSVTRHRVDFDRINRLTGVGLLYDIFTRFILNIIFRKSMFVWRGLYTALYFKLWLRRLEKRVGLFDLIIVRGQGTFEYLWPVRDPRMMIFAENIVTETSHISRSGLYARLLYHRKNIACVSNGVRESIQAIAERYDLKPDSLEVYYNPCPIEKIREMANERVDGIPDEPYIVNVARLVPQKNHRLLIEAYARAGLSEKLVIVGGGGEERALREMAASRGLKDKVIFAGSRTNPYPWMKHAKLFVLSSKFEGFGVVLVESMACGTPVVAVDCPGGVRDVLIEEQQQYLVPEDPDALAEMMRHALAHPLKVKDEWIMRFDARKIAQSILLGAERRIRSTSVQVSGNSRQ